jgi:hypothetical protein
VRTVNRYCLSLHTTGTIIPEADAPNRNNRSSQSGTVVPPEPTKRNQ